MTQERLEETTNISVFWSTANDESEHAFDICTDFLSFNVFFKHFLTLNKGEDLTLNRLTLFLGSNQIKTFLKTKSSGHN